MKSFESLQASERNERVQKGEVRKDISIFKSDLIVEMNALTQDVLREIAKFSETFQKNSC